MSNEFKIETPYLPGEKGCRITWLYTDDEEKTLYLRHEDLMEMIEILEHGTTAKIEMEDGASSILVNSDSTDFFLAGQKSQKIETVALKIALREFIKGFIGRFCILSSPLRITLPLGTRAEIEVKKRKVVPEFSTFNSPGFDKTEGGVTSSVDFKSRICAPKLIQDVKVALVSRENNGLTMLVGESDNNDKHNARCV